MTNQIADKCFDESDSRYFEPRQKCIGVTQWLFNWVNLQYGLQKPQIHFHYYFAYFFVWFYLFKKTNSKRQINNNFVMWLSLTVKWRLLARKFQKRYSFMWSTWYLRMIRIARILHSWYSFKKMGFLKLFSFFKLNLSFEDDVIKKFDMTFRCDTFYVDSKVLIAFVLAREEC